MATIDIKYLTQPHDGQPGTPWDDFEERILNVLAGKSCENGWSLADCVRQIDEGSAGGPAMPGAAAALAKAQSCQHKRFKDSYAIITQHELDTDHRSHMSQNHFQDGPGAWAYLISVMRTVPTRLEERAQDKRWDDMDIMSDVGVEENSLLKMSARMKALNAKRPVANRKNQTQMTEKFLEMLFSISKHFSESALVEYNAPAANWQFVLNAGPANGQRDFHACVRHYHLLWQAAVNSRLPGFHTRAPVARPATNARQTLEAGLIVTEGSAGLGKSALMERALMMHSAAGSNDYAVPRSGSPARTLELLAVAGNDLASRHGTTTTTDWGELTQEELCAACEQGGKDGEFEMIYQFDADNVASVELICDGCGGHGHIRRVCPSNQARRRSIEYCSAGLQARLAKKGPSSESRRPPGRGQRAPFQSQPRRYAPVRRADGSKAAFPKPYPPRGPPRRRAFTAEEGEENYEEDVSAENEQESHMSVQEPAPKQPVSFSDDSLYEDEKSLVMTEVDSQANPNPSGYPPSRGDPPLVHSKVDSGASMTKVDSGFTSPKATVEKELKTKRAPETKLKTGFLSWLMAIGVLLMAYVAATLEGLARAIACLGVVGVTGVVAMSIMVESAPTERLMPCRE